MRRPTPDEFLPLPYFGWLERPLDLPLDIEDCATAIYLKNGDLDAAAARLKVTPARLDRVVCRSPRLTRLRAVLLAERGGVSR
jgi:hypothetical protein